MSSYSAEAADQVVRIALSAGGEILRLSGNGAWKAARLLAAALKDARADRDGSRERLRALLRGGEELRIFPLMDSQVRAFALEAKRCGVAFTVVKDRRAGDGVSHVLVRRRDAARAERIAERFLLEERPVLNVETRPAQSRDAGDAEPVTEEQKANAYAESLLREERRENGSGENPRRRPEGSARPSGRPYGTSRDRSADPSTRPSVRAQMKRIAAERRERAAGKKPRVRVPHGRKPGRTGAERRR